MYTLVKFLSMNQAVLQKNGKTYVASFSDVYTEPEVLVFKSNPDGEILDWSEVDGGRGYTSLQQFLSTVLHNPNYRSYTS